MCPSYGGVKKSQPKAAAPPPKEEGKGLVTKTKQLRLWETPEEEDSTEATAFDDDDLMPLMFDSH
jgi:hypothetical protein